MSNIDREVKDSMEDKRLLDISKYIEKQRLAKFKRENIPPQHWRD